MILRPIVRRVLLAAAWILLIDPAQAGAEWRAVRTNHFHVIGDVSAGRLRDVALRFEQFREVVTQLLPAALRAGSAPVVVIVFPDARSYRPFMPVVNGRTVPVDGFFVDGADVNYITMNVEAGERAFPVIFHEFCHLLLNNAFAHAPLWFNEGLAEYFSTFEVANDGRRALIGKPIGRHVALLRERRLKLSQLFAIGPGSKEYTQEGVERDLLYSQSWALVHYARHGGQGGSPPSNRWRGGWRTAKPWARACAPRTRWTSKRSTPKSRRTCGSRSSTTSNSTPLTASSPQVNSEANIVDAAEVDGWLADLLAHLQRGPEAIPLLERALRVRGDLPRALATLGILRIRQGNRAEGLSLLERAAAAGPDIESVQFEYGWALATEKVVDSARAQRAQAALERAIALRPGYPAAIQMLASVYGRSGDFAKMRDLLTPLVKAAPDNQDAALQLAAALLGLGDIPAARALLGPILARPHDAELRDRARTLLGELSKVVPGP